MTDIRSLILASGSRTRREMLASAGITFEVVPAFVDEAAVREVLLADGADGDPADVAEVLARAKAEAVSALHPHALVIGGDQVLACEGRQFEKPADVEAAHQQLAQLRGKTHQLHSAVVLAAAGETVWSHVGSADLTMRDFSPRFLADYLAQAGARVTDSVGAYQLEGLGVQLFERIDGDYFTILGLPLLPLLIELRERGHATH